MRTALLASAALIATPAVSEVVTVESPSPAVQFEWSLPDETGAITMFPPAVVGNSVKNDEGVYKTEIDGKAHDHIATIAAQASGLSSSDIDLPSAIHRAPETTDEMRAALNWLVDNAVALRGGASTWHYSFRHPFNSFAVKPGWPSAFAQSDVVKAFLLAAEREDDARYLDWALRAGLAFTVPCEDGGLRCEVEGHPWYAEIPLPYGHAPMIFNGHGYSIVMLHHLYEATKDERIKRAYDEGVAVMKDLLPNFDTGYWSVYDIRPRTLNTYVVLNDDGRETYVRSVTVETGAGKPSKLDLIDAAETTWTASGTWGEYGSTVEAGREIAGPVEFALAVGPQAVNNMPLTFGDFTIGVEFTEANCEAPEAATFDWRAGSTAFARIELKGVEKVGEACRAEYGLPLRINKWAQIDPFYHDWHSRLVRELWRQTGDPTFYATAVRWFSYLRTHEEMDYSAVEKKILDPVFDGSVSERDDARLMEALAGRDPGALTDDDIRSALKDFPDLLSRAGVTTSKPN